MTVAFQRLADVCREQQLRTKILVAPSLAIGHQIADAIAQGGTDWVNVRIETVRTIADSISGFDIAQRGLTVLSRAQALALVERACARALGAKSYFAALADRPGLHRAIQRSIDDLRHAGVSPSGIPTPAFEDPRKGGDIRRILEAYEEELRSGGFVDRFGVLARAIEIVETRAHTGESLPHRDALWFVAEELELTSAEERLLQLVAENVERAGGSNSAKPELRFRSALGEENEIRAAFRAIVGGSERFDRAEIVYTTRDPYLPLAIELAAEHDVPCTFAEGIPSFFTRPGRACLAVLQWMGGGWHAAELQLAATAGALRTDDVSGAAFTRTLRKAGIGWGRERYLARIDALLQEQQTELEAAEDDEEVERITRRIADARATRAAVEQFLELSAEIATGDAVPIAAVARAAAAFVARFAAIRNRTDGMARDAIVKMLEELAALPNATVDRAEASARLADAVRAVHVAASNPQPGSLHVAPLRSGGWSGRPNLFVVGLDESRHPGRGLQDPVVLDAEREAINRTIDPHRLLLMAEAPRRAAKQFELLMRRAAGMTVTLSYSAASLTDRQEQFPSAAFLDAYRVASGNPNATYDDVAKNVGRDGFVDSTPISATEWWLMRRFADGSKHLLDAVRDAYPLLASGAEADAAREGNMLTAWDACITPDPERLDPRRNGRVYSASQLQKMAECPFSYFVDRHLRVKPVEEVEFDGDRWLNALDMGSLLHEVLEATMLELTANGRKPVRDFFPRMTEIAEVALQRWRQKVPPPGEAAFERDRSDLLTACDIFLRVEEEACRNVTPKYFEVSFGFGEEEGIAIADPFSFPLGHGRSIPLRGKIDRVDHDETADEWHVWDYKSGITRDFEGIWQLRAGTKVQHAIYAAALQEMLRRNGERGKVTKSGYFFPTAKGRGMRTIPGGTAADLKKSFNALSDVVAAGLFPQQELGCKWCDFEAVCGGGKTAGARMKRKLDANPGEPGVAAWRELQSVK